MHIYDFVAPFQIYLGIQKLWAVFWVCWAAELRHCFWCSKHLQGKSIFSDLSLCKSTLYQILNGCSWQDVCRICLPNMKLLCLCTWAPTTSRSLSFSEKILCSCDQNETTFLIVEFIFLYAIIVGLLPLWLRLLILWHT